MKSDENMKVDLGRFNRAPLTGALPCRFYNLSFSCHELIRSLWAAEAGSQAAESSGCLCAFFVHVFMKPPGPVRTNWCALKAAGHRLSMATTLLSLL